MDCGGNCTDLNETSHLDLPDNFYLIGPITTTIYVIIFVLGVIGNFLVCYVVLAYRDMRENISHVFLANLSIADLLVVLVCVPTAMVECFSQEVWYLGEEMCKAVPLLEYSVAHVSALTMLAISFERLLAIVFPLKATYLISRKISLAIIVMIWIIAFLSSVPFAMIVEYQTSIHQITGEEVPICNITIDTAWEQAYIWIIVSIFFTVPFFVLVILYAVISHHLIRDSYTALGVASDTSKTVMKARRSVVAMLATVVATFFICLLPFRALSLWAMYAPQEWYQELGPIKWYILLYFSRIMFYLNSSINPIVLYAMSAKFRSKFQQILCCRKAPHYLHNNNVSRTGTLRMSYRADYPSFASNANFKSGSLNRKTPSFNGNGNGNHGQRKSLRMITEESPML